MSVHIERLAALLRDDFDVSFLDEARRVKEGIPNIRRMSPLAYMRLLARADVVHVHSYSGLLKIVHVACARLLLKRVVLTVHSVMNRGFLPALALACSSRLSHAVVAVSDEVGKSIRDTPRVIPAFIPPSPGELTVSASVARWIADRKAEGRFVFASNAYRLELYRGEDLYGLDLLIDAFASEVVSQRCACVFVVGAPDDESERLKKYEELVARREMEGSFLLHSLPENFAGIAALADGTIRATSYDGDALSIRESLHLGKVTLASDAAIRPEGTRTFKSRDVQSLIAAILSSVDHVPAVRRPATGLQGYRDPYVALYTGQRRPAD